MTTETSALVLLRRAFTLVEVIVAITVMALMMVGLLAYVQSGSELWHRGQSTINLRAYYRMVSESIERDLNQALAVTNTVGSVNNKMRYIVPVKQGALLGTATVEILHADGILKRHLIEVSTNFSIVGTISVSDNEISRASYEYVLARNVATFSVTRISSYSMQVNLGLRSVLGDDESAFEASKNATMTFVIPSGK
jgi:prepilin-type N-terminal cleavage/methylation domain-containing protein